MAAKQPTAIAIITPMGRGNYLLLTCSVGCDAIFDLNTAIIRMVFNE